MSMLQQLQNPVKSLPFTLALLLPQFQLLGGDRSGGGVGRGQTVGAGEHLRGDGARPGRAPRRIQDEIRHRAGQAWRRDPREPDLQVRSWSNVASRSPKTRPTGTELSHCESCTSLRRLRLNNESCTLLRRLRLNVTSKLFSFTTFNYEADAGNVS